MIAKVAYKGAMEGGLGNRQLVFEVAKRLRCRYPGVVYVLGNQFINQVQHFLEVDATVRK